MAEIIKTGTKKRAKRTSKFFKIAISFKVANPDTMEVKPEGKIVISKFISKFNSLPARTIPFHSYEEAFKLIPQVLAENKVTFVQKKVIETRTEATDLGANIIAEKTGEEVNGTA